MSLDPLAIALQGFQKTPLAIAVQGLLDLNVEPPDETGDVFPGRLNIRRKRLKEDEEILLFVL